MAMKLVLSVLAVLAYAHARGQGTGDVGATGINSRYHVRDVGTIQDSVRKYITDHGYPAEIYEIETEDGYYLKLVRIPYGKPGHHQQGIDKLDLTDSSSEHRPAILLVPGMMATYEDFVIGGPSEGLAFRLADEGYDVYLGNVRGSFYGQGHKTYDPERDVPFWRYSFEEIGTKDLPAMIDQVIRVCGQAKIYFIGHMQGTTAFYTMASERPEYVDKIKRMVALGPVVYMENAKNDFLKKLDAKIKDQEDYYVDQFNKNRGDVWIGAWMANEVGVNTYGLSSDILNTIKTDSCLGSGYEAQICKNIWYIVNGFNSRHFNKTTTEERLDRIPSPASSRQILHHVQNMISGRFQKYDKKFDRTSQSQRWEYDLSKVTVPVVVFYTPEDTWSHQEDVQRLINEIPNCIYDERIDSVTNNVDLLFGDNVNTRVYDKIVRKLGWNVHTRPGRKISLTL